MRIEKIECDEAQNLLRIQTEEGEDFEIALQADEARGLTPGLVLDEERLAALRRAADRKQIARKVFRWLDRRRRSMSWLREKLLAEDHDGEAVTAVLSDFARQGLVDDREYARAWCSDQLRRKPVGRRWLFARLRREGIGEDDAWAGIDIVEPREMEAELAAAALRRRALDLGDVKQRARAMRFLQSRGFEPATARSALDELRQGEDESVGGELFDEQEY
jgi:regulatory protein